MYCLQLVKLSAIIEIWLTFLQSGCLSPPVGGGLGVMLHWDSHWHTP